VLIAGLLAKRAPRDGSPVRQTLEAMLAANRRARINYRIFWMSLPVFILPTADRRLPAERGRQGHRPEHGADAAGVRRRPGRQRRLERAAVLQGAEAGTTAAGGLLAEYES
jgi:hypothetical protein